MNNFELSLFCSILLKVSIGYMLIHLQLFNYTEGKHSYQRILYHLNGKQVGGE